MKNWGWIGFLVFVLFSCGKKSEYPGYSVTDTGLNYAIHSIGTPSETPHDSEVVKVNISVTTMNDSLIYAKENVFLYRAKADTSLNELIGLLAVGDSATAILAPSKLPFKIAGHPAKAVKVHAVIETSEPYLKWAFYQKYPQLKIDLELEEQVLLQKVLNRYKVDSIQCYEGVFVVHQIVGAGRFPQSGDMAVVQFETFTPDGKKIDSTVDRNQAFTYVLGVQDQVLEGFDIGVRKMKKGGKATFIVPSTKAFGATGSSTGIAKEYQSLIFTVELVQLNPNME